VRHLHDAQLDRHLAQGAAGDLVLIGPGESWIGWSRRHELAAKGQAVAGSRGERRQGFGRKRPPDTEADCVAAETGGFGLSQRGTEAAE
jgi:hypothetical protein